MAGLYWTGDADEIEFAAGARMRITGVGRGNAEHTDGRPR